MNDGLPLLLKQSDEPLLAVNVTVDALINVVEIADDGGLLVERRDRLIHAADKLPLRTRHLGSECRSINRVDHRS